MTTTTRPLLLSLCAGLALTACAELEDTTALSFRVDVGSEQTVQHQNPNRNDIYGRATAIYGTHAMVGAPFRDIGSATNSGSVETFSYDGVTWNYTGLLTYPSPLPNQTFGDSIDIYGSWAVIGAPGYWGNRGKAVLYEYSGGSWQMRQILTPTGNGSPDDLFGAAVSISGNRVIVGVPGHDGEETNSGRVYVYSRTGSSWSELQQVEPSSAVEDGNFGRQLDIASNGFRMVVAAPNNVSPSPISDGNAEVFVRTGVGATYLSEAELVGPGPGSGFANDVAIAGPVVLIGEPGGGGTGQAKTYRRSGGVWNLQATLVGVTGGNMSGASFGTQVELVDGNHAFVTAPGYSGVGQVFEFRFASATWAQDDFFGSADTLHFGSSIDASASQLVVGDLLFSSAPLNMANDAEGRAHFYATDPFDPPGEEDAPK